MTNQEEMYIDSVVGSWVEWICKDSLGQGQSPMEFVSCAEELISRLEAHVDSAIRSSLPDPMDVAKYG